MNPEQLLQVLSKSQYTRTDYFRDKTHEYLEKVQEEQNLTGRFARQLVRKAIAGTVGYKVGELGLSEVGGMLSRKERRELAKEMKIDFVPVYNGSEPVYASPIKEKKKKEDKKK
jgi:hypothetical protein